MQRFLILITAVLMSFALASCDGNKDNTDSGGVTLSVTDFDVAYFGGSVNLAMADVAGDDAPEPCFNSGFICIEGIEVTNVPLEPGGTVSSLMNVEINSYEVVYSRNDNGTRSPPRLVRGVFGVAEPNGSVSFDNLPIMTREQLENPPLSDLLFENGGFDSETGDSRIAVTMNIRFFGRTVAGAAVASSPASYTIDLTP